MKRTTQEQPAKQHYVSIMILAVAAILAITILWRIVGLKMDMKQNTIVLSEIAAAQILTPDQVKQALANDKQLADQLKKSNPFTPPPPKPSMPTVRGILGDLAFMNGKWVKAGDKVGEAEILTVEPTCVNILWLGKKKTLYPIQAADLSPSKKISHSKKERKKRKVDSGPKEKTDNSQNKSEPEVQVEDDPLAWLGVQLSPSVRAKLLEMWNKMSDEQKEKMKEHWNSMTQEQKEQAVKVWEQRL